MEHLPDDVLLAVMQFLDVPALLTCRLVCKRVASLALLPSVWRHQTCNSKRALVGPVLSLAPCLRQLIVGRLYAVRFAVLLTTARCAAENLKLFVSEGDAMLAALVVRHQASLGRLKRIELDLDSGRDLELSVLLSNLSTICDPEKSISSTAKPVSVPSLTHLTCSLYDVKLDFVNRVLTDHAATLEVVILYGPIRSTSKSTARLLASAPNLSTLKCPLLPGMEALAACKSLQTLSLDVSPEKAVASGATGAAVTEFLRRTNQLRRVRLDYGYGSGDPANSKEFGEPLVAALAGHSCLESLDICNHIFQGLCLARPLLGALTSLPALRHVQLGVALANVDALLLGVTPAVVPVLRSLKLFRIAGEVGYMRCIHSWIHREATTKLLLLNPSLDLIVLGTFYCNDHLICEYCAAGCHHELQDEAEHEDEVEAEIEEAGGEIPDPPCRWRFVPRPGALIDRARGLPE